MSPLFPTKSSIRRALLCAACLFAPSQAVAEPSAPPTDREARDQFVWQRLDAHFFARWDPDSDGRIAMTDLPPRLQALLAPADANHDGYLTRDEMWRARAAWKAKLKALADANGDGTVTPDERKAALPKLLEAEFVRLDANHDGALTANEVADKRWARLVNADTNGDRRVTLQEFVAFRTRIAAHQSRQR